MSGWLRVFRTVRHLRRSQVFHQVFYRLSGRLNKRAAASFRRSWCVTKRLKGEYDAHRKSFVPPAAFTFLNRSHDFGTDYIIDWDYPGFGKLWTYNLNYFDFIRQPNLSPAAVSRLLASWLAFVEPRANAWEPYPTSLRIVNLLGYHAQRGLVPTEETLTALSIDYEGLWSKREFHLSGNHLLENALALLAGACCLGDTARLARACTFVREQLADQYLTDGAHYELSPTYHALLCWRTLLVLDLAETCPPHSDVITLMGHVRSSVRAQLGFLQAITPPGGGYARLNDVDPESVIDPVALAEIAKTLGLAADSRPLRASGYRVLRTEAQWLLADVGPIGPDHIPGHGHCDLLSFVLYSSQGQALIVDPGVSTYELGARRAVERSTGSHNTVQVGDAEQSEIWGAFRVGRRARARVITDTRQRVRASHDGYLDRYGITHSRSFGSDGLKFTVLDEISGSVTDQATARFHFAPGLPVSIEEDGVTLDGNTLVRFEGALEVMLASYIYATGFGDVREARCLEVRFEDRLHTTIQLRQ